MCTGWKENVRKLRWLSGRKWALERELKDGGGVAGERGHFNLERSLSLLNL